MTAATSASLSAVKWLRATTGGTPKRRTFSTCFSRLARPARTASRFSAARRSLGTPPCIFSARTVATITAADGVSPPTRHLMSKNFSAPSSVANPASVTTTSASLSAVRVAIRLLQPWAMLAKGPPWTKAGVPSKVCTRFGLRASRSSTVSAPATFSSPAAMNVPSARSPTIIRARRALRSARSEARQSTAMISEATVISKPDSRGTPCAGPPRPMHDVAQGPVVHVDHALPGHPPDVEAEGVALEDVVVEHGGQQTVCGGHGVKVAGEVEVDLLHRHDLGVAAARPPRP